MMINETVILLAPFSYPEHRLSRYIDSYLRTNLPSDLNFYKPLQKIFSKVILYDYVKRQTEIGVKAVNEEIIDLVRREYPKYAIWLSGRYEFLESTFDTIRKEGTILSGWFFDDAGRFDEYSKWWIPHLDYCVTNAIEAVPKYRALNARVILAVQIGVCILIDRDWSNIRGKYDVSFVGIRRAERKQYINELKNRNIPIHVFGEGWGRYVPFEEMIDIFRTSKINLNFSRAGDTNKMQIKGRIFEICMAGGFLLTEYAPGIENYFEIDKEIVCFRNKKEMVDKITYYLNHDEERRAIAQAGWKRATSEHTSFHMLSRVFGEIEKDIAAKGRESISHPPELKMPMQLRRRFSNYYFTWAVALSLENHKGLWKDALALSISYNPFNIRARLSYIIGFFPPFMRSALFGPLFRLYIALRYRLSPIPYLRRMKQSLVRKLFYT